MINILNLKYKKGFTLIELLVVISIISLLSSVVYASLTNARDRSRIAAGMQGEANILHGIGDQLVGEWKFDEGGTTVLDTSSFGNNGTVINGTYIPNGGYNGKGTYKLTRGSSYISLGAPSILNIGAAGTSFTISAWVNYNLTSPNDSTIFWVGAGYANGNSVGFNINNDKLALNFYCTVCTRTLIGTKSLSHNRWTQVVVTFNGVSKQVSFYVDGVLDNTLTSEIGPSMAHTDCAYIGNRYCGGGNRDFEGMVDNMRVYSAAISSAQIQQIFAEEKSLHPDLALKK